MLRARDRRRSPQALTCAWSLSNQLANAILVLVLVTGPVASVNVADFPLAIDDDGTRHFIHVVRLAYLVRGVEQHGEAHRFTRQQVLHCGPFLIDIDADEREARRLVFLV